jgi:hypothetical protein
VFALGLVAAETGAMYARIAADKQAFLVATSAPSERLVLRVTHSFEDPIVLAHPKTLGRIASGTSSAPPSIAKEATE